MVKLLKGYISDHTLLTSIGSNTHTQIDSHIGSTSNPHSVTLTQVGGTLDHTALSNIGTLSHSTIDSYLDQSVKVASSPTFAGVTVGDHGTASTDIVVNVCYGVGDPPEASTTTEGALFIKYSA